MAGRATRTDGAADRQLWAVERPPEGFGGDCRAQSNVTVRTRDATSYSAGSSQPDGPERTWFDDPAGALREAADAADRLLRSMSEPAGDGSPMHLEREAMTGRFGDDDHGDLGQRMVDAICRLPEGSDATCFHVGRQPDGAEVTQPSLRRPACSSASRTHQLNRLM